jgi:uncharacterized protein involved in outer membrane biogenesis
MTMKLRNIALGVLALILVLVIAAVVAIRSIDFNRYKGLISDQVTAATGRKLTIGGNLDLRIGFTPAITVADVSFANAPWGSRPEMVTLQRFEVEVALIPLIFRKIEVKRLVLVQPDILLETDTKGTGNWSFGAPATPPSTKPAGEKGGLPAVAVEKLRIEKGTLTYRDGRTKQVTSLALERLDLEAKDLSSPVSFDLAAAYNEKPFKASGTVGALSELQAPTRPYPVKLALQAGGATVDVAGTIAKPMEAEGLSLTLSAKGQELADVAKLAGRQVPPIGPFSVAAKLSGSPRSLSVTGIDASLGRAEQVLIKATGAVKDALGARGINVVVSVESKDLKAAAKAFGTEIPAVPPLAVTTRLRDAQGAYAFEELKATLGKSSLGGSGSVSMGPPRPKLTARLASPLLDLSELLPGGAAASAPRKPAEPSRDKRMIPADPLPLESLKVADADLDLKVDRLVLPDKIPVEALAVRLVLAAGRLDIQPFSGRVGGGAFSGRLALDAASGKVGVLTARLDAKTVDLGQLMQQMGRGDLVSGVKTDLTVDLKGSGGSVRDLMAGLNGDLLLTMGEGKINNKFVDFLGADLLTQLVEKLNPLRQSNPQTDLVCGVVKFAAKDGVATTDRGIAFETSQMNLVSSGTANLKTEGIDFSFRPSPREASGIGAGQLVSLLRLRGTLGEPKIGIDEMGAAQAAASLGEAVARGGISGLTGSLTKGAAADSHPCQTALGKPGAPSKTGAQPSAPPVAGQPGQQKGGGVDQLLKGLFGK